MPTVPTCSAPASFPRDRRSCPYFGRRESAAEAFERTSHFHRLRDSDASKTSTSDRWLNIVPTFNVQTFGKNRKDKERENDFANFPHKRFA